MDIYWTSLEKYAFLAFTSLLSIRFLRERIVVLEDQRLRADVLLGLDEVAGGLVELDARTGETL